MKKTDAKQVDFKETLWKAADKLRNQLDAADYKHIVLGLIFLKYISDTFEKQKEKVHRDRTPDPIKGLSNAPHGKKRDLPRR